MLSNKVRRKLESLKELPSIPAVITSVLHQMQDDNYNAKNIATQIEQDQGLTAKILRVANSPYYGMVKKISTIDLAIIILGAEIIKEVLIGILLQKIFQKINSQYFNAKQFWEYSIFCGAASRYLARKLEYKLVSEAFVCGLMHDIGLLILSDKFRNNFAKVRRLQKDENLTLTEAENIVFECTHSDVGAWIAERWNFPENIIKALEYHHTPFQKIDDNYDNNIISSSKFKQLKEPLTAIVSISEWLSFQFGYKQWDATNIQPDYYITNELLANIIDDELLTEEAALSVIKQSIVEEYEKSITNFPIK